MDFIYIVFWIGLSVAVAMYASRLNRSGGAWFCLSIIISPLLASILLLAMGEEASAGRRKCPSCAEMVKAEAMKCRFCGTELTPVLSATDSLAAAQVESTVAPAAQQSAAPRANLPPAAPAPSAGAILGASLACIGGIVVVSLLIADNKARVVQPLKLSTPIGSATEVCNAARHLISEALSDARGYVPGTNCENFDIAEKNGGWDGSATVQVKAAANAEAVSHAAQMRLENTDAQIALCRLSYNGTKAENLSGC